MLAQGSAVDLRISGVNKWYSGGVHAVKDMDMEVYDGEFLVFVGPSGCGKTTLLRMIAGLETISGGEICLGDRVINRVAPKNRDIAMVFQNYALYPNMRVRENIEFPLRMRGAKKKERSAQVAELAEKLELGGLLERKPGALSGGQRQRVALARAMVRKPQLFLMDEPLSNLDAKLRVGMRREIVTLQRELGVTTIYVTHDQTEAMTMGTRIAVIHEGVLQQIGTPQEIYNEPKNLFVAGFIGSPPMNIWKGSVRRNEHGASLSFGGYSLEAKSVPAGISDGELSFALRPEHIKIAATGDPCSVPMTIVSVENMGRESIVFLRGENTPELTMIAGSGFSGSFGDKLRISLDSGRILFFDSVSGERIV